MGRKKGKQSLGFHSKTERGLYVRSIATHVDERSNTSHDADTSIASISSDFKERPRLVPKALSCLRAFLSEPRAATATLTSVVRGHATESFAALPWPHPRAQTLAELCADRIGETLSGFDLDYCEPFSYLSPDLVARVAAAASVCGELNDRNAPLLLTADVESLSLHGEHLSVCGLASLLPAVKGNAAADVQDLENLSVGGIEGAESDAENDTDWERKPIRRVLSYSGCRCISTLSIWSPLVPATFIELIGKTMPGLRVLALRGCPDASIVNDEEAMEHLTSSLLPTCISAGSALLSALPLLRNLEELDLSGCLWVTDELLLDVLPVLPTVALSRFVYPNACEGHPHSRSNGDDAITPEKCDSPNPYFEDTSTKRDSSKVRMRLRQFICRGSSVTHQGAELASSWHRKQFHRDLAVGRRREDGVSKFRLIWN